VLATLNPASVPQNVIQAQSELLSAQQALDELKHPSALSLANAQKAVADAQKSLTDKERALKNLVSPDVAYYQDQYNRAQQSLTAAQQNAEITNFQTSLRSAKDALDNAANNLKKYQDLETQYPGYGQQHGDVLTNAQKTYERALQDYQAALYNLEQAQARNENAITDAQEAVATARGNLAAAKAGPEAVKQAQAEADVAVAQAKLAEAEQTLVDLQRGGNADDLAAAKARVQAAQATVDSLYLTAPFDGEVLTVNYLPGDLVSQSTAAMVLANRTQMHVDVSVDESDVTEIQPGDPATLTFDPIAGLTLAGQVAYINPLGQSVQGLVRYTVRVDLAETDPRVLVGMTANVNIVTDVQEGALAVPYRAVQLDEQGEYVNRLNSAGAVERVAVVSGETQDDVVVVTGALSVGELVQIPAQRTLPAGGPFGGQ
jgi:HlyD family secretion protein